LYRRFGAIHLLGISPLIACRRLVTEIGFAHQEPLHNGVMPGVDGVVPEVSADDLFEPFPLLADRLVHPLTQFPALALKRGSW